MLEVGAELYVQGPVRGTGDGLAIAGGDRVIGAGGERTVAGRLRRGILIGYTAGPVLIVLGLVILVWISINTRTRVHP